jgi:hypothetical protein
MKTIYYFLILLNTLTIFATDTRLESAAAAHLVNSCAFTSDDMALPAKFPRDLLDILPIDGLYHHEIGETGDYFSGIALRKEKKIFISFRDTPKDCAHSDMLGVLYSGTHDTEEPIFQKTMHDMEPDCTYHDISPLDGLRFLCHQDALYAQGGMLEPLYRGGASVVTEFTKAPFVSMTKSAAIIGSNVGSIAGGSTGGFIAGGAGSFILGTAGSVAGTAAGAMAGFTFDITVNRLARPTLVGLYKTTRSTFGMLTDCYYRGHKKESAAQRLQIFDLSEHNGHPYARHVNQTIAFVKNALGATEIADDDEIIFTGHGFGGHLAALAYYAHIYSNECKINTFCMPYAQPNNFAHVGKTLYDMGAPKSLYTQFLDFDLPVMSKINSFSREYDCFAKIGYRQPDHGITTFLPPLPEENTRYMAGQKALGIIDAHDMYGLFRGLLLRYTPSAS